VSVARNSFAAATVVAVVSWPAGEVAVVAKAVRFVATLSMARSAAPVGTAPRASRNRRRVIERGRTNPTSDDAGRSDGTVTGSILSWEDAKGVVEGAGDRMDVPALAG
jgi:hypothetical protein